MTWMPCLGPSKAGLDCTDGCTSCIIVRRCIDGHAVPSEAEASAVWEASFARGLEASPATPPCAWLLQVSCPGPAPEKARVDEELRPQLAIPRRRLSNPKGDRA